MAKPNLSKTKRINQVSCRSYTNAYTQSYYTFAKWHLCKTWFSMPIRHTSLTQLNNNRWSNHVVPTLPMAERTQQQRQWNHTHTKLAYRFVCVCHCSLIHELNSGFDIDADVHTDVRRTFLDCLPFSYWLIILGRRIDRNDICHSRRGPSGRISTQKQSICLIFSGSFSVTHDR